MQAILEAHMTGSVWAAVAPLVVGFGIEMPIIDIPLVADVVPAILEGAAEFWELVDSGAEPPLDYSRDRQTLEALFPVDDGGEVDLVSDRRAYQLIEHRADLIETKKATDDALDEIDTELKSKMKGAGLAYLPGGMRMTWRTQRRVAADGTVKVFRVLRVPRPPDRVMAPAQRAPEPETTPPPRRTRNEPWNF
jgi:hypothetical protein